MKIPSFNDQYSLLALFISPWKDAETTEALADTIQKGNMNWKSLLYMANLHFCAPLWFVRMREDGLLSLLPNDLREYLHHLHQANIERNTAFQFAIQELYSELECSDIPAILLKGGATLCDDLYQDLGARMMGDIDLLVKTEHTEFVRNLFMQLGYKEQPDCFARAFLGYFNTYIPHHLPRQLKPGTPVVVEIHSQTALGQAARVMQTARCWKHKEKLRWKGLYPFILRPTYRLLHNTVHSPVQDKKFITSTIPLRDLSEYAYLVRRYESDINWCDWLENGSTQSLNRVFRTYLTLAHRLMGVPFPKDVPKIQFGSLHVTRISNAENNRANYLSGRERPPEIAFERIRAVAIRILIIIYYKLKHPTWVWQNFCYKEGIRNIPIRIFFLLKFFVKRTNYKRFFNKNYLLGKSAKVLFLIKKPNRL
jgi:hypothetical protein